MNRGTPDPDEIVPHVEPDPATGARLGQGFWRPLVDVYADAGLVFVTVELPGVDRGDIGLSVGPDHVRIAGHKRLPGTVRSGVSFYSSEIPYGRFDLVVELPVTVDPSAVHAALRRGVLHVELERARRAHRSIPID